MIRTAALLAVAAAPAFAEGDWTADQTAAVEAAAKMVGIASACSETAGFQHLTDPANAAALSRLTDAGFSQHDAETIVDLAESEAFAFEDLAPGSVFEELGRDLAERLICQTLAEAITPPERQQ